MRMRALLLLASLPLLVPAASASETTYLYKAKLVQAAPGKLLEVIDLYKASLAEYKNAGDEPPLWMRHSQGDHWDLLILIPMNSYGEYYNPDRIGRRKSQRDSLRKLDELIAWQEDVFVTGHQSMSCERLFRRLLSFMWRCFTRLRASNQSYSRNARWRTLI